MNSKIRNQWIQISAVVVAAACAVTATVAGVSGSFSHSPITAYALESGYELSLSLEPNDDGEGYHYNLDLSDITKADVGKKISIEFTAAKYKNQTLNGAIGYSDPTDGYNWAQTKWEAKSDANGTYTVEFEITEGLVGHNAVQVQCWYPTCDAVDSYKVVFDKDGAGLTTTTTKVTESSESSATVTTAPEKGTDVTFTEGTQEGKDGDIQAVAEFDPSDAKYAVIKYKVLSDDLESSGGIGTWNGEWTQVDFKEKVGSDGIVTVTYKIPSDVGQTVKAMVFSPSNTDVKFQSITLYKDSEPTTTTSSNTSVTEVTTTKATTTTTGFTPDKTISVGATNNTINVINKCYLVATMKASAGTQLNGAVYYDNKELKFNGTTGPDGLLTVGFKIRSGLSECNFQIQGSSGSNSIPTSFTTYYLGDASLNGKINGSDIRAIANYLKGSEKKTEIKNAVCDYNGDGSVTMIDAELLTKALIGPGTIAGNE